MKCKMPMTGHTIKVMNRKVKFAWTAERRLTSMTSVRWLFAPLVGRMVCLTSCSRLAVPRYHHWPTAHPLGKVLLPLVFRAAMPQLEKTFQQRISTMTSPGSQMMIVTVMVLKIEGMVGRLLRR
jgi:hypothetical protein